MNLEQKIEALEGQIKTLTASYSEATDLMQFLGGSERVFQSAVLAMIQVHPDKTALRPVLKNMIERSTSAVLFGSQNESHLQGAQDAYKLIQDFLDE